MQSIGRTRGVSDLSLQAADDFAQGKELVGDLERRPWLLNDTEARHRLAFGIIGGLLGEECLVIVFVAFGFPDRERDGQHSSLRTNRSKFVAYCPAASRCT